MKFLVLALIPTLLLFVHNANAAGGSGAGPGEGGGGNAVMCYKTSAIRDMVYSSVKLQRVNSRIDSRNEIDLQLSQLSENPTLADLFEIRDGLGFLQNPSSEANPTYMIKNYYDQIQKMAPAFYQRFSPFITRESQWRPASSGVIELADANYIARFPANCLVVQVAYFDDRLQTVSYDRRITDLMNNLNKVGLKMHEDVYRFYRASAQIHNDVANSLGVDSAGANLKTIKINSDSTRNFIGRILMTNNLTRQDFDEAAGSVAVGVHIYDSFVFGPSIIRDYPPTKVKTGHPISHDELHSIPNLNFENPKETHEILVGEY